MRFLFYSHDSLGLGHTRRHLTVAAALARRLRDATILLATGAEEVARYGLPRQVEILKLPGLRKDGNEKYSARRLPISVDEIRSLRAALLLTTVKALRPAVVLVDKHPFGASGEFKDGLRALRRLGGRAVLGLRDILDNRQQVLREWRPYRMQKRIAEFYDEVLVYGDRRVFDPIQSYEFPAALARRTHFCGYVLNAVNRLALENFDWPFAPREQRVRPVVLASVGGGEDGFRTLDAFVRASSNAPWQGIIVGGPMMPDTEWAELQRLAAAHGVMCRSFVPHLSALFDSVDALVCMGGYNTLVEAAALGVPTVCVPRVAPRTEQLIRAEAFERLGLLQVCRPEQLSPELLRQKIADALRISSPALRDRARAKLDFLGAERAAERLSALAVEPAARSSG